MMSLEIKDYISQISISGNCFSCDRDRNIALEVYKRHNLQSVLESVSDFSTSTTGVLTCVHGKSVNGLEYLQCIGVLIKEASACWISDFAHGFNDETTRPLCIGSLKTVLKYADEQPVVEEHCDFDASHFKHTTRKGYVSLNIFNSLFTKSVLLKITDCGKFWSHICFFCLCMISRHAEQSLWTDTGTHQLATDCLDSLLQFFACSSAGDLLVLDTKSNDVSVTVSPQSSIFGKLISEWHQFLLKSTWKQNPIVANSFSWCCRKLKFPHAGYFLQQVLTPSLLFTDDYMLPNKVMGVQCLTKIIENTGAEELRWYGRADVIYEALKQQIYTTEEELITVLHPALLGILNVVVKRESDLSAVTKYDDILQIVLHNAAHENNIALRRVQTEFLHSYIEKMGIGVVKHMKKIVALIEEYLEVTDAPLEQARLNLLKCLNILIRTAWPRISTHCFSLVKAIIKLIQEVSVDDQNVEEDIREHVIADAAECLYLLQAVDKDKVNYLLTHLDNISLSNHCQKVIAEIRKSTCY